MDLRSLFFNRYLRYLFFLVVFGVPLAHADPRGRLTASGPRWGSPGGAPVKFRCSFRAALAGPTVASAALTHAPQAQLINDMTEYIAPF